jgi:hypothetical protein
MKGLVNVIVYIDDILLHSKTHQECRAKLEKLFNRLRKTNLKVKLKKCEFGADNVSYLNYRLTPEGILPGSDKLKVINDSEQSIKSDNSWDCVISFDPISEILLK